MPDFKTLREFLCTDDYPWDDELTFGQNLIQLFSNHFVIPHANIQIPILAAFGSLPSAICTVVPILWLEGSEGSGKSNIMNIYSAIYDVKVQNASWSFASIRNEIENNSIDTSGEEKHFVLCLDNLNEDTFNTPFTFDDAIKLASYIHLTCTDVELTYVFDSEMSESINDFIVPHSDDDLDNLS